MPQRSRKHRKPTPSPEEKSPPVVADFMVTEEDEGEKIESVTEVSGDPKDEPLVIFAGDKVGIGTTPPPHGPVGAPAPELAEEDPLVPVPEGPSPSFESKPDFIDAIADQVKERLELPDQVASRFHSHQADDIAGLDQQHEHESKDVPDFEESVSTIVSTGLVNERLEPLVAPGQKGKLVRESHTHDEKHGGAHSKDGTDPLNVTGLPGVLADPQKPQTHGHTPGDFSVSGFGGKLANEQDPTKHKTRHMAGGDDAMNVGGMPGKLADPQTPEKHVHKPGDFKVDGFAGKLQERQTPEYHGALHGQGQPDEVNVTGLPGVLKDPQKPTKHGHAPGDFSVSGFSGTLKEAQTPISHRSSHEAGKEDEIDVSGLMGELNDPQVPKQHGHKPKDFSIQGFHGVAGDSQIPIKHASRHSKAGDDPVHLGGLPGIPKALADHMSKSGAHGATGPVESTSNKGRPSGYASLDAAGNVVEMPANATETPAPNKIPITDGNGTLDAWVSMSAECVRIAARETIDEVIPPANAGDLLSSAGDGLGWNSLEAGDDGDTLTMQGGVPAWVRHEDTNSPPWVGKFYAAFGDCDPVKLMTTLTTKAVGNGPSPSRLGKTVRAVLFRPPGPMDVHTIYMVGTEESMREYQIAIYRDEQGSGPLVTTDVNTARGLFPINIPKVHLDAGRDYWFCLASNGGGIKEYLRSMVSPAFPIINLRGFGLPVLTEWDIEDGKLWGELPECHVPIRALAQNGGTIPLAFLSGG